MNKTKYIYLITGVLALLLLSEAIYAYNNKHVLYSYSLKAAKLLNNIGSTGGAFFVATQGKYTLPNNDKYRNDVKNDFQSLPSYFDLQALTYKLAVTAYQDHLTYLTPELLNISIMIDPDFSFWRVELANYYLLIGNMPQAQITLENCIKLVAPRQHCQDYMNNVFKTNQSQNVGFLDQTIRQIYEKKNGQ